MPCGCTTCGPRQCAFPHSDLSVQNVTSHVQITYIYFVFSVYLESMSIYLYVHFWWDVFALWDKSV
jgi:hypothetical protein